MVQNDKIECQEFEQFCCALDQEGLSDEVLVERLLDDQRTRWSDGKTVLVEEYFSFFPHLSSAESSFAIDLIYNEFLLSQTEGNPANTNAWLERFPDHAEAMQRQFDVYEAVRHVANDFNQQEVQGDDVQPEDVRREDAQSRLDSKRFLVRERLGSGTFADVYRTWDAELKRDVAIKFARRSAIDGTVDLKRFRREAEAAAKLAHPGVVAIYEIGPKETSPFIIQEYVAGGTLKERIRSEGCCAKDAAEWTLQIADAIDYAHSFGVVHRDVKPANILFTESGRIKVADFGLASLADQESQLTQHGEVVGTPAYMSPEQASGESVGASSDVYSIGVVLFELLNGTPPFVGSASVVLNQVLHQEAVFTRKLVPVALKSICLKAMSKQARDRYPSARALAMDLGRYLHGEPVLARPLSVWEKSFRWLANQPALVATLFGACLILFFIGSYSFWRIQDERQRFREQRDIANERLLESLLNSATTSLRSKQDGWFEAAMTDLKKVARHPDAFLKLKELREKVAEAVCDEATRIQVTSTWQVTDNHVISCLARQQTVLLVGVENGEILCVNSETGAPVLRLLGPQEKIEHIECANDKVWALAGGEIWEWDLTETAWPDAGRMRSNVTLKSGKATDKTKATVCKGRVYQRAARFCLTSETNKTQLAIARHDGRLDLIDVRTQHKRTIDIQSKYAPKILTPGLNGKSLFMSFADKRMQWVELELGTIVRKSTTLDPIVDAILQDQNDVTFWTTKVSYQTESWRQGKFRNSSPFQGAPIFVEPFGDFVIVGTSDGTLSMGTFEHHEIAKRKIGSGISCAVTNETTQSIWVGDDQGRITQLKLAKNDIKNQFFTVHGMAVDSRWVWSDASRRKLDGSGLQGVQYLEVSAMSLGPSSRLTMGTAIGELFTKRLGQEQIRQLNGLPKRVVAIVDCDNLIFAVDESGYFNVHYQDTLQSMGSGRLDVGQVQEATVHGKCVYVLGDQGLCKVEPGVVRVEDAVRIDKVKVENLPSQITSNEECIVLATGDQLQVFDSQFQSIKKQGLSGPIRDIQLVGNTLLAIFGDEPADRVCQQFRLDLGSSGVFTPILQFDCANGVAVHATEGRDRFMIYRSDSIIQFYHQGNRNPIARLNTQDLIRQQICETSTGDLLIGSRGVIKLQRDDLDRVIAARASDNVCAEIPLDFQFEVGGASWAARWSIAVQPRGEWVAMGRHYGKVEIVDPESMKLKRIIEIGKSQAWRVTFSPDSNHLAIGTGNAKQETAGVLKVLDVNDWSTLFEIEIGKRLVAGLSYHPTRPIIAVSSFDGGVWIVDSKAGKLLGTLVPSQPEGKRNSLAIMDVEFSPDGKWLAAVCKTKGIYLWELSSKEETPGVPQLNPWSRFPRREIGIDGQRVWALAFDATSQRLVTASEEGQIDIFSVGKFEHLLGLKTGLARLRNIKFSPENSHLVVSAWTNNGAIFDLERLENRIDDLVRKIPNHGALDSVFPPRLSKIGVDE